MSSKRRRFSPLPLAGLSLGLLLLPSGTSQRARLTLLTGYEPFRRLAMATVTLPRRVAPSADDPATRAQIDFLRDQVEKYKNENEALKRKLEAALGARQAVGDPKVKLLQADVVFPTDSSSWRKSLTLALGSRGGVRKGMLVLYNEQLVGRVVEASAGISRVMVVTDPAFRARAVAVPRNTAAGVTLQDRHIGVYEGTAGRNGQLKWITGDTPVEPGASVLTTEDPLNAVPRGLALGLVSKLSTGRGPSLQVEVEPALDFRALEHVTLLAPPEDMIK